MRSGFVIIFLLCLNHYRTQTPEPGLYLTAHDYLKGKLTHSGKDFSIRRHELFKRGVIRVDIRDSSFVYLKNEVYGYRDKLGKVYRFFQNEIFPMLNPGESLVLYKVTSGTGFKNSPVLETYFFSKDADSKIWPLTIDNINKAFSGEEQFKLLVEIFFRNDRDLVVYDPIHLKYKLNRLIELSSLITIK